MALVKDIQTKLLNEKSSIETEVLKSQDSQLASHLSQLQSENEMTIDKKRKEFELIERDLIKNKNSDQLRAVVTEHQKEIDVLSEKLKKQLLIERENMRNKLKAEFADEVERRLKTMEEEMVKAKIVSDDFEKKKREQEQAEIAYRAEQEELMNAEKRKLELERVIFFLLFAITLDHCKRKES